MKNCNFIYERPFNEWNGLNDLTGKCPKVFGDFVLRKCVEKWQFSDNFCRISG